MCTDLSSTVTVVEEWTSVTARCVLACICMLCSCVHLCCMCACCMFIFMCVYIHLCACVGVDVPVSACTLLVCRIIHAHVCIYSCTRFNSSVKNIMIMDKDANSYHSKVSFLCIHFQLYIIYNGGSRMCGWVGGTSASV